MIYTGSAKKGGIWTVFKYLLNPSVNCSLWTDPKAGMGPGPGDAKVNVTPALFFRFFSFSPGGKILLPNMAEGAASDTEPPAGGLF